jgi:hypothetical protein
LTEASKRPYSKSFYNKSFYNKSRGIPPRLLAHLSFPDAAENKMLLKYLLGTGYQPDLMDSADAWTVHRQGAQAL